MIQITQRDIAQLTPAEQHRMVRWIGEHSHLTELASHHTNNRAIRQARDEAEAEIPGARLVQTESLQVR